MNRGANQYVVRFPDGLRDQIKALAKANRRSMNAEIIVALEARMQMTAGAKASETGPAVINQNAALQGGTPITKDERTVSDD